MLVCVCCKMSCYEYNTTRIKIIEDEHGQYNMCKRCEAYTIRIHFLNKIECLPFAEPLIKKKKLRIVNTLM